MSNVVHILATGGTIASTANAAGARVPTLSGAELVRRCRTTVATTVEDAAQLDSSSITLGDLDTLRALVTRALADPAASGVVLTHGTDSMAETALALDLVHADPRPVVLTGAQLPADAPDADGPANLRGAIEAAADPTNRGAGVVVHFAGTTHSARGLYKASTAELAAFASTCDQPLPRPTALKGAQATAPLAGLSVPILRAWPGADGTLVDMVAASRPDGIVVEALGSGNVSDAMGAAIVGALETDIPVVIASSVPRGGVHFDYGGLGGGATLASAGALAAGHLSPGQARIALLTALASGADPRLLLG